jgi:hypothetical protein
MFLFPQPNTTVNTPLFGPTGEIGNIDQVIQTSAWSGNPVVEYSIEFSIKAATGGVGPYEYEYKFRRNQYMFTDVSLTTNISDMSPIPITMSATQSSTFTGTQLYFSKGRFLTDYPPAQQLIVSGNITSFHNIYQSAGGTHGSLQTSFITSSGSNSSLFRVIIDVIARDSAGNEIITENQINLPQIVL